MVFKQKIRESNSTIGFYYLDEHRVLLKTESKNGDILRENNMSLPSLLPKYLEKRLFQLR
jgi:hypothetical protein